MEATRIIDPTHLLVSPEWLDQGGGGGEHQEIDHQRRPVGFEQTVRPQRQHRVVPARRCDNLTGRERAQLERAR